MEIKYQEFESLVFVSLIGFSRKSIAANFQCFDRNSQLLNLQLYTIGNVFCVSRVSIPKSFIKVSLAELARSPNL